MRINCLTPPRTNTHSFQVPPRPASLAPAIARLLIRRAELKAVRSDAIANFLVAGEMALCSKFTASF
ncbi:hypothetical protein [Leptolyngbya sp. Heron Island J]|uniref:hypothetical protein n=1 Tax=Leptolyngbya sp. Heron Island J TaxID=1385935 RepID=UPI0004172886|nr:hypothetical protein [Leptolyngbya sp. Heron Island J]